MRLTVSQARALGIVVEDGRATRSRKPAAYEGMSEHQHQCEVIDWRDELLERWPVLGLLHAIPNGGKRDKVTGAKLKAEGALAGMPDLCLPVARHGFHALYVEMKTPSGSLQPIQKKRIAELEAEGNRCYVAYNFNAAIDEISRYLSISRVLD